MGTNLIDYEDCEKFNLNVLMKRYWGGEDDGIMFQITEKNACQKYINISGHDMLYLCIAYLKQMKGMEDEIHI